MVRLCGRGPRCVKQTSLFVFLSVVVCVPVLLLVLPVLVFGDRSNISWIPKCSTCLGKAEQELSSHRSFLLNCASPDLLAAVEDAVLPHSYDTSDGACKNSPLSSEA